MLHGARTNLIVFILVQGKNLHRMQRAAASASIAATISRDEMETLQKAFGPAQRTAKNHRELNQTNWHTNILPID